MRKFKEIAEAVGYDKQKHPPKEAAPEYFAYKQGVVQRFKDHGEALRFSKILEKVIPNAGEIRAFWDEQKHLEQLAVKAWHLWLREEYKHLSDDVYRLCYEEAYDRGHSAGYDEVASYMSGIVEFAEKILKARG